MVIIQVAYPWNRIDIQYPWSTVQKSEQARYPAGSSKGGQFAPKGGGQSSSQKPEWKEDRILRTFEGKAGDRTVTIRKHPITGLDIRMFKGGEGWRPLKGYKRNAQGNLDITGTEAKKLADQFLSGDFEDYEFVPEGAMLSIMRNVGTDNPATIKKHLKEIGVPPR